MPIHVSYSAKAKADELRGDVLRFRRLGEEAGLDWPGDRFDWLVAVPSTADLVAATILGLRPRHVLLLATARPDAQYGDAAEPGVLRQIEELREWLAASGCALVGHEVAIVVQGDESQGILEKQLLPTIARKIPAGELKHVAIAMTSGTTPHKIALGRYAEVHRMWQVLCNSRRDGQNFVLGSISLKLDLPPFDVTDRLAERTARIAVRGRQYGEARRALSQIAPSRGGAYWEALSEWIDSCAARDAMRFGDAASHARKVLEGLESVDGVAAREPGLAKLAEAARRQIGRCEILASEMVRDPEAPRLALVIEVLRRGVEEEEAGRLNHAALMYYRAIEAILSERLRVAWGIRDSEPAPTTGRLPTTAPLGSSLPTDASALEARFLDIAQVRRLDRADLWHPLGLVEKLVLLVALDDPNLSRLPSVDEVFKTLNESAQARNASIFAHGFHEMRTAQVARLRGLLLAIGSGGSTSVANGLVRLLVEPSTLRDVVELWEGCVGHVSADGNACEPLGAPRPGAASPGKGS